MSRPRHRRPIRIEGNIAFVALTQGYEALIDAADVPLVADFSWCADVFGHTVYARCTEYSPVKCRSVRMHRLIMGDPNGFQIDHKDSNGLNNRRSNLRIATVAENRRNVVITAKNTSGYKGVSWDARFKKWHAYINFQGKRRFLGYFDAAEAAHAAYVLAAVDLHGEFARPK